MIEATLCFTEFLVIFLFAGHIHRIGLAFLAPLSGLVDFKLSLTFEQTVALGETGIEGGGVTVAEIATRVPSQPVTTCQSYT